MPPRTTTLAARPAVDHNPADLEPPPSTNQRRKQRGKWRNGRREVGVDGVMARNSKPPPTTHDG